MLKIISSNYQMTGEENEKLMEGRLEQIADGQVVFKELFEKTSLGEEIRSETLVECCISEDGESFKIMYEEPDENSLGQSNVEIECSRYTQSPMSITRRGRFESKLYFENDRLCREIYHTPYMNFGFTVFTLKLDNRLCSDGVAYVDYIMIIDGGNYSRFTIELSLH